MSALTEEEASISLTLLEKGVRLIRESKKKLDERVFRLRMESNQVVTMSDKGKEEVIVNIDEIKEVRPGRAVRELDRSEGNALQQKSFIFTIYHGSGFVLKTTSFIALNSADYNHWIQGLRYLRYGGKRASYHTLVERWLWKHYFLLSRRVDDRGSAGGSFTNSSGELNDPDLGGNVSASPTAHSPSQHLAMNGRAVSGDPAQREFKVSPKDLKAWLARVHSKMPLSVIKERFPSGILPKPGYVDFYGFIRVYEEIMFNEKFYTKHIRPLIQLDPKDGKLEDISIQEFAHFLEFVQMDEGISDETVTASRRTKRTREMICQFLNDKCRAISPALTLRPFEFLDYLFSKSNSVWRPEFDEIYQDMTRPISEYWIASSHNTYLTGDQFASESSCEAYSRALRMGCRCIELDCWNGDVEPIIYHGHTLTSKIKLRHALNTIKEYAWVKSEYPLILSIENHCDVQQQRIMAQFMQETFQDELLKEPLVNDDTKLPCPEDLKRKIILKHKKLPVNADASASSENLTDKRDDESGEDCLLNNNIHSGRLYMEDPVFKNWVPYFAVLTNNHKLVYTEDTGLIQEENAQEVDMLKRKASLNKTSSPKSRSNSNLATESTEPTEKDHRTARWYHGRVERQVATDWILRHWYLGDGAFIVRDSETFTQDFSLSFYRSGKVHHVRIKRFANSDGSDSYGFESSPQRFPGLRALIHYYQTNDMVAQDFKIRLRDPLPPRYHNEPWFYDNIHRESAELMLGQIQFDGAFLVRAGPSKTEPKNAATHEHIVLSFRAQGEIHHCPIIYDGFQYSIGGANFPSLVTLVEYYRLHRIYKQVRLRYPCSKEILQRLEKTFDSVNAMDADSSQSEYIDLSHLQKERKPKRTRFVAKYDYFARNPDELSFRKGAVITNVTRVKGELWQGDLEGQVGRYFPAYLVEEVCVEDAHEKERSPLGNMEMGCIELTDSSAVKMLPTCNGKPAFRLFTSDSSNDIAVDSDSALSEWTSVISSCLSIKEKKAQEREQMERIMRIAKQLSDLIVYCRSVAFNWDRLEAPVFEMHSFPEQKFDKLLTDKTTKTLILSKFDRMAKYLMTHLGRVYPRGTRLDSSNFDPMFPWSVGVQMVALNYQTGDRGMQLNQGRFRDNGGCGYVLKRDCGLEEDIGGHPIDLHIEVLAGRHLPKVARACLEVEVVGGPWERNVKMRPPAKGAGDVNLCPIWNYPITFYVHLPDSSLIRFAYCSEERLGDSALLGQAAFPVKGLRPGLRSVSLRNGYGEPLELAALLIRVSINPAKKNGVQLRRKMSEITKPVTYRRSNSNPMVSPVT